MPSLPLAVFPDGMPAGYRWIIQDMHKTQSDDSLARDMEEGYYSGNFKVDMASIAEVDAWARYNGGELAVRVALAEGKLSKSREVVTNWIALQERQRMDQHAQATLLAAERSALAAERAARWAMWSALISAAVGVVAAGTFFYTFVIR